MSQLLKMRACLNAMSGLDKCGVNTPRGPWKSPRAVTPRAVTPRGGGGESEEVEVPRRPGRRRTVAVEDPASRKEEYRMTVNGIEIVLHMGGILNNAENFNVWVNSTQAGRFTNLNLENFLSKQLHNAMYKYSSLNVQAEESIICHEDKTVEKNIKDTRGNTRLSSVKESVVEQYHAGWQRALGRLKDEKNCKYVIHAYGPTGSESFARERLTETIKRTLKCVELLPDDQSNPIQSVAFPVFSGNQGDDLYMHFVHESLVAEILAYVKGSSTKQLKKIGIFTSNAIEFKFIKELLTTANTQATKKKPIWATWN